jgi:hypothetical protein
MLLSVHITMMMMTLCIRYKAQLAVTKFGPRHTTHFVLLEKVSGGLATLLPTRTLSQTKSAVRSPPAASLSPYITSSSPRSARRRLVRPCCLAAQPAHCPCPPGRGGCVVALVVALRRSPSCRQHGCVAVRCAQLGNPTALQEFCLRIPRPALRSILRISRHMRTQYQNRQNALRAICQMRIARNTQSSP